MTSNIGSEYLMEGGTENGEIPEADREPVLREMRSHVRPEFLNRVDDIVLFSSLTLEEIKQIVDLQTEDLRQRLAERGVGLELSGEAKDFIARKAYDPVYGARPLKRYLQHEVETKIGRALIAGEITEGSTIQIEVEDGTLATSITTPEPTSVGQEA